MTAWPPNVIQGGDRVLVIVPSRDRPKELATLIHTIRNTSASADVAAYIDEDQRTLYSYLLEKGIPRVLVEVGPRIGPVAAANHLAAKHLQNYVAFGFVPDDARFTTRSWDDHVMLSVRGGPRAVAPSHATTDVDMPFVSREWIERLGWFAWPGLYHWGWPSVVAALGDALGVIRRSHPQEFFIDHPAENSSNRERYPADIIALYDFFASHFKASLDRLRWK